MNMCIESGLRCRDGSVPLISVHVSARVSGTCVEVGVTQRYRNTEPLPIEAVYVFPLDQGAAVCGFHAKLGEQLILGHVEEREAAFAAYDDALHAGDGAFLLDQERPNVFTASVGNLAPGATVELHLRYVALLPREGDALRLTIPTTVSPRYVPQKHPVMGQPDAERVNPEHWSVVPYGLTLQVEIEGAGLKRVESPSHPVRTTLEQSSARVELSQEQVALDRDFVLLIERRNANQPFARVARDRDGRRLMLLEFLPAALPSKHGHEVLFLLDCSGSMQGESIDAAKRALSLCIRALGPEDTFNLICFGDDQRELWPKARRFDQASLDEASRYISEIDANLGGTEILTPLRALLEAPPPVAAERRVLVLTDGQVSNEAEVIALAQRHAAETRIFAFGIGTGASEHLVRGMARASRGAAEMIFPGERIEPKVLRTFARARTPALDDVHVDYKGLSVEQAPRRTPPVFSGDALSLFARIEAGSADHVELVAGAQRFRVALDLEHAEADGPIPTLWARECIRELDDASPNGSQQRRPEHDERQRARLVELGKRYGLLSSATSFVAIEERAADARSTLPAALRRIPVALTAGWGGRDLAGPTRSLPFKKSLMESALLHATGTRSGAGRLRAMGRERVRAMVMEREEELARTSAPAASFLSPAQASLSAGDRVFELLVTQRADGSFARSEVLERWLGDRRSSRLAQACARYGEEQVVTRVVIALLTHEAPERESEWRLAVAKAESFCRLQTAVFDPNSIVGA